MGFPTRQNWKATSCCKVLALYSSPTNRSLSVELLHSFLGHEQFSRVVLSSRIPQGIPKILAELEAYYDPSPKHTMM